MHLFVSEEYVGYSFANLCPQSKCLSHVQFLFGQRRTKNASFAVMFVSSNSASVKSKIAKQSQVNSVNQDGVTINLLFYSLCKRLFSLSRYNFSRHV